jgi:hypothetical protein
MSDSALHVRPTKAAPFDSLYAFAVTNSKTVMHLSWESHTDFSELISY